MALGIVCGMGNIILKTGKEEMKRITLVGLSFGALALAACAGSSNYVRDGATEEDLSTDLYDCRGQANLLSEKDDDITQDISAGRPESLRAGNTDFFQEVDDIEPRRTYENVVDECMNRRGYHTE